MDELVSILIPVYNRVSLVGKAIDSSITQTYKNIEIIVVDNCSTDGTWELLNDYSKRDSRIKVFRNSENIGPVRNWLECLKHASGSLVKILFSDDWLPDDYIEKTVPLLQDDVALVFSGVEIVNQDNDAAKVRYNVFDKNKRINSDAYLKDAITLFKYPVSPGCALFRKADVEKNLLIEIPNNENLIFSRYGAGNDKLIFLLTADAYKYIAYCNDVKAIFLGHTGSFSISENLKRYYELSNIFFANKTRRKNIRNFLYTWYAIKMSNVKNEIVGGKTTFFTLVETCINLVKKKLSDA